LTICLLGKVGTNALRLPLALVGEKVIPEVQAKAYISSQCCYKHDFSPFMEKD
jgi:hypothetical protein